MIESVIVMLIYLSLFARNSCLSRTMGARPARNCNSRKYYENPVGNCSISGRIDDCADIFTGYGR